MTGGEELSDWLSASAVKKKQKNKQTNKQLSMNCKRQQRVTLDFADLFIPSDGKCITEQSKQNRKGNKQQKKQT